MSQEGLRFSIKCLREFEQALHISNRETEDVNDPVSVAYSSGLEEGVHWAIEELVKEHLKTYDLIVRVPIRKGFLTKDKQRSLNPQFQKDIDLIINKMLKKLKIKYIDYNNLEEDFILKIKGIKKSN